MNVSRAYQRVANVYALTHLPMPGQDTVYSWEGKRLSRSYVGSYESFNIVDKIDDVGDSRPMLIGCFALQTQQVVSDKEMSS